MAKPYPYILADTFEARLALVRALYAVNIKFSGWSDVEVVIDHMIRDHRYFSDDVYGFYVNRAGAIMNMTSDEMGVDLRPNSMYTPVNSVTHLAAYLAK